jgi:hypothetical protein
VQDLRDFGVILLDLRDFRVILLDMPFAGGGDLGTVHTNSKPTSRQFDISNALQYNFQSINGT